MWPPEPARQEHLSAEAVETFQVLYDTLGRPRGLRNVSRRACRSIRHSPREGHQRQFGREAVARVGGEGSFLSFRRNLVWQTQVRPCPWRRHTLRRRRHAVPVASQRCRIGPVTSLPPPPEGFRGSDLSRPSALGEQGGHIGPPLQKARVSTWRNGHPGQRCTRCPGWWLWQEGSGRSGQHCSRSWSRNWPARSRTRRSSP
jgi:hypothetical protein